MNVSKLLGLMGEHKHTQADIAMHLNIASSTLTLKLSGKTEFKASEIEKLCNLYNVKADYFFSR